MLMLRAATAQGNQAMDLIVDFVSRTAFTHDNSRIGS